MRPVPESCEHLLISVERAIRNLDVAPIDVVLTDRKVLKEGAEPTPRIVSPSL